MSYSESNNIHQDHPLISTEVWEEVLQYLAAHIAERPFNLYKISEKLLLSIEQIVQIFSILRKSFNLFHQIQQEKLVTQNDIFSYSIGTDLLLKKKISSNQMNTYITFTYLWEKRKISPTKLNSELNFRILIEKFPFLFKTTEKGWKPSDSGRFFAEEYRKSLKLNKKKCKIEFKNIQLSIQ